MNTRVIQFPAVHRKGLRPEIGRSRSGDSARRRGRATVTNCARFLVATMFAGAAAGVFGGSLSISWFTIDGGGGTSTSNDGRFSVSGTIGQPDAGVAMTGVNVSLAGGFWSLYAVPVPGAPRLNIQFTPTNTVIVFWPSPSTGWTLQENTNGLSSGNWTDYPFPQDNGTNRFIIVNPPTGNRFYRLKKP